MKTLLPGASRHEHSGEREANLWWPTRRSAGPVFGRRLRLTLYLLGLAVGIAVFVRWLFHNPVKTPIVALALTDYAMPAPPNSYAFEDVQHLEAIHRSIHRGQDQRLVQTRQRTQGSPQKPLTKSAEVREWLKGQLERTKPAGPGGNTVVLYISAHGVVNENGAPCLLLEDDESPGGRPLNSGQWLPVDGLLEEITAFREAAATSGLELKVLLVLDACRMDSNWSLGLLYNGFADRLKQTVEAAKANAPWLVVINSTSPGEIGWTSPYLGNGRSVFGYFFSKALEGYADTAPRDRQITLHELDAYLSEKVPEWVWNHRYARQTPMLIPALHAVNDFPLFYVDGPANRNGRQQGSQTTGDPKLDSRLDDVEERWGMYARLCGLQPYRFDPLEWAELEHQLLHLEQLMMAGTAVDTQFTDTRDRIDSLDKKIRKACGAPDPAPQVFSIPLARQLRGTVGDDQRPNDEAELVRQLKSLVEPKSVGRKRIDGFLKSIPDTDSTEFVEVHFLRMLRACLDWDGNTEMAGPVALALQARDKAERAAAPADERTHYMIKLTVNTADQERRAAEDALFVGNGIVGNRAELDKAKEKWHKEVTKKYEEVFGQYEEAVRDAEDMRKVYQLRDQAWAVTPWLAQGALRRMRRTGTLRVDGKDMLELVGELIKNTQELGKRIDDTLATPKQSGTESDPSTRTATFESLKSNLEALNKYFRGNGPGFADLSREANSFQVASLPKVHELLAIPPVSGVAGGGPLDREQLVKEYVNFLNENDASDDTERGDRSSGARNQSKKSDNDALQDSDDYLAALARYGNHPALEILKGRPPNATPKDRDAQLDLLDEQGGLVRDLIVQKSMHKTKNDLATTPSNPLAEAALANTPANRFTEVRRGLSEVDRYARGAAVLFAKGLGLTENLDPTQRLRSLDLRFEMLWQCHRAIEDFWSRPLPDTEGPDYFADAGQRYLKAAGKLSNDWDSDTYGASALEVQLKNRMEVAEVQLKIRMDAAEVQLKNRMEAAKKGVILNPEPPSLRESSPTPLKIQVMNIKPNLPNGTAALYVEAVGESAGGRLLPVRDGMGQEIRRWPLKIAADRREEPWVYGLPSQGVMKVGDVFNAVTLFRGHRWPNSFPIYKDSGGIVAKFPCRDQPAHVSILPGKEKGWVVFILDCSGTMSKPCESDPDTKRLDQAKSDLWNLFQELPVGRFRVGLMFYGHRAAFDFRKDERGRVILLPIKYSQFPRKSPIHPDADAEWASESLELGPNSQLMDQDVRNEIETELDKVEPWGQTPLYLALKKALDAFAGVSASTGKPRHIVLITDGANDLYLEKYDKCKKWLDEEGTTVEWTKEANYVDIQMLDSLAEQNGPAHVKVHVLALQMKGEAGQFKKLVNSKEDWDWIPIGEMDKFGCQLKRSLGIMDYRVEPRFSSKQPSAGDWKSMWEPWMIGRRDYGVHGSDFSVQSRSCEPRDEASPAKITIEGGEWLELHYEREADRLVHERCGTWDVSGTAEEISGARRKFFVGAKHGSWKERGGENQSALRLCVSVQNNDEQEFSPRPKHIWAEISPEGGAAGGNNGTYFFYDRNFVLNTPVPVLQFDAPKWPFRRKAKIDLWFRMEELPKNECTHFPVEKINDGQAFRASSVDGVTFTAWRLEDRKIRITERHDGPGLQLGNACVELVPTPSRAEHHYFPKKNEVEHVFFYNDPKSTIRIISSQWLKNRAIKMTTLTVSPPP